MDELAPATLVLTDGEIALRCWRDSDAAALAGLCRDDEILRWTRVPDGYTEQMARDRSAQAESERRAGSALLLAVVTAQTDELLGACDLLRAPQDRGRGEISYMLGAHARGRGVMARAVALLARWAIEELGLARRGVRPPRQRCVDRGSPARRLHRGGSAARVPRQARAPRRSRRLLARSR